VEHGHQQKEDTQYGDRTHSDPWKGDYRR